MNNTEDDFDELNFTPAFKAALLRELIADPAPDLAMRLIEATKSSVAGKNMVRGRIFIGLTSTALLLPLFLLFLSPSLWLVAVVLKMARALQDTLLQGPGLYTSLSAASLLLSFALLGFALLLMVFSTRYARTGR